MTAYRFCRPDDMPLIVRAVQTCFDAHFPGTPELTLEDLRREIQELDLWPSNSMVALVDEDPIAVLTATKRQHEVLVRRIGVRPGWQRQGHGRHLLTSLSQKLAVLGPPRLAAEIPEGLPGAAELFAAAGYRQETVYSDWLRAPGEPPEPVPEGLVIPVTVSELADGEALRPPDGVAWERTRETLLKRRQRLEGYAIASPDRIEAHLLVDETPREGALDIWSAGATDPDRRALLLVVLLRHLIRHRPESPLRLPSLAEGELPEQVLEDLGFELSRRSHRWAAEAKPL